MSRNAPAPSVIAGAAFDPSVPAAVIWTCRHSVNPRAVENRVGEPEAPKCLRGFFSEKMIDPVGWLSAKAVRTTGV